MHPQDYQVCKCGAIGVDKGEAMICFADDWQNFVRVDDEDNEIVPKIEDAKKTSDTTLSEYIPQQISDKKKQLIGDLEALIGVIKGLPSHALDSPITHRDYETLLSLILGLLRLS